MYGQVLFSSIIEGLNVSTISGYVTSLTFCFSGANRQYDFNGTLIISTGSVDENNNYIETDVIIIPNLNIPAYSTYTNSMINLKIEIGDTIFIGSEFTTEGGFIYISGFDLETEYVTFIDRELIEKVSALNIPNRPFLVCGNVSVNPNNIQSILDKNITQIDFIWTAINNIISRLDALENI
jgi:NDP-sugar pyrophosphorylase family protein